MSGRDDAGHREEGDDAMTLRDDAERMWTTDDPVMSHVVGPGTEIDEVDDGLGFILAFGNVMPVRTGDGLVIIDTSMPFAAANIHHTVRSWSPDRLHTAIFTHGHIDHVGGVGPFDEEAAANGWPAVEVVAHEEVPTRFDRYVLTNGHNSKINERQFSMPGFTFPTEWRYPDRTFRTTLDLDVGGVRFELHHARGETDDHTWVHLPDRKVVYPGDLFIWCVPNAGNPQKVQRYAADWAAALRAMQACEAEIMVPSHGLPVFGADRVHQALDDTASLLESLHDQTVALMNEGRRLDEIIHTVEVPAHLTVQPYLQPIYDDPEFIVRNVWRFYGGWHDGDPARLKPAPAAALATELADLAGGPGALAARAEALAAAGELRLAGHLAELAAAAAPDDKGVHRVRAAVNNARVAAEPSLMAKGIFGAAARESAAVAEA
ncbi:MAG: alkyl sulfatase dimerization domain-containing protein [Acidimicrobiales bacterium]